MTHRWTDDDDLLVIDLYLRHGALGADRTEVRTLARVIGTTPASIASVLANVLHLDTGRGLPNYAEHMPAMWAHWGHRPADVAGDLHGLGVQQLVRRGEPGSDADLVDAVRSVLERRGSMDLPVSRAVTGADAAQPGLSSSTAA